MFSLSMTFNRSVPVVLFIVLLTGCLTPISRVSIQSRAEDTLSATLTAPGSSRIHLEGYENDRSWHSFSLANRSPARAGNIVFWGQGRSSIIRPDTDALPPVRILPFSLLPGEHFVCTSTGRAGEAGSGLIGTLLWEIPDDLNGFKACLEKRNRVHLNDPPGLTWYNLEREGMVEFLFSAPFPHRRASLNWAAQTTIHTMISGDVTLDVTDLIRVWISSNGKTWVRINPPRGGVSWINAMDLTELVRDRHSFMLRLSAGYPEDQIVTDSVRRRPGRIILTRMRVEREISAPGGIRPLKKGSDSIPVQFDMNAATPNLQFHIWNDKVIPGGQSEPDMREMTP
jgi:hypothetical protein